MKTTITFTLLVKNYLKGGYVDRSVLRGLGLMINELPAVVQTRQAIDDAVGREGHVYFRPF